MQLHQRAVALSDQLSAETHRVRQSPPAVDSGDLHHVQLEFLHKPGSLPFSGNMDGL